MKLVINICVWIGLTTLYLIMLDYIQHSGIINRVNYPEVKYLMIIGSGFLIGALYSVLIIKK